MQKIRTMSVQRTSYHKVVMHYIETAQGTQIVRITPDVGPLIDISVFSGVYFTDPSEARTALRVEMKNRTGRDLSFLKIMPKKWIEFVLALDDFLVGVGLDFDDLTDDVFPVMRACQTFSGVKNEMQLVAKTEINEKEFKFDFGIIDWNTFTVN